MTHDHTSPKISPEFMAHLSRVAPSERVRAILVLSIDDSNLTTGRRPSPDDRRAAFEAMQRSAEIALPHIDDVLDEFGGQRLADHPSALGTIPIEATPAGILSLANSKYIRAILQDQPVSLLRRM